MARKNKTSVNDYLKKILVIAVVVSLPLFLFAFINYRTNINYAAKPEVYGSITLADPEAQLSYGDSVSFVVNTTGKMPPKASVYITVVCTPENDSSKVVYQWSSRNLSFEFPLVDQSGDNLDWDGGPANCSGNLMYNTGGNRNYTISIMDSVEFPVAGQ